MKKTPRNRKDEQLALNTQVIRKLGNSVTEEQLKAAAGGMEGFISHPNGGCTG